MEALTGIAVLVIVVSALGMMTQPLLGRKVDLFWLIKPIGRWIGRLPARGLRNISNMFWRWSRQLWRYRPGHWGWYCLTIPGAALLAMIGMTLQIPAELLP